MSNPESKQYNTIFMGPLTHRETRLDAFLNAKKDIKWSEEAENEYLESVKTRATEKVRALLLQAKRRSDEIVREAEQKAREITALAEENGKKTEQKAQETLKLAQQRYEETYAEAVQKAHAEAQQILMQNQQALGESTAIVLLSIHEQIAKFYDVWKEDLKQLTIDAIEVGTGWIASGEKEAILKQLLDESVQKLLDKKNFIVRVNPADAELITQVLENSREKGWSMESSKDLEPGSLELESDNVYVKNSRTERQKFVQEILDNLTLPATPDEQLLTQNVKTALDREMQHNPVLAHALDQNSQSPLTEIPLEKIMPDPRHTDFEPAQSPRQTAEPQMPQIPDEHGTAADTADSAHTDGIPLNFAEPDAQAFAEQTEQNAAAQTEQANLPNEIPDPLQAEILAAAQNAEQALLAGTQSDGSDMFEALQQEMQTNAAAAQPQPETALPQEQTEVIKELPTFSSAPPQEQKQQAETQAHAEALDMVEEFLGTPKKDDTALPSDIADDLLAELGFSQK